MYRWMLVLFVAFSSVLRGGDWVPVPPATWEIREDAKTGIQGAVILDESARYGINDSEFTLRVLILSEAGKAAVQFDPFPSSLDKLEGRTVYPDGHVVEFSKTKDFAEQTVDSNRFSSKQKVLVPPGITAHCILDLHWNIRGTYLWGTRFTRSIQRAYPISNLILKLSKMSPMGSVLLVPANMRPVVTEDAGYRIYTFKSLPAMEDLPYSRWGLRTWPRLMCFRQPRSLYEYLDKTPEAYWNRAVEVLVKPGFSNLESGRYFKDLEKEILENLPEDPLKKSATILERLNGEIRNLGWMTSAERAARTKDQDDEYIHALDLNEGAKRRWTNRDGMHFLAYQLLKDANLHPKLMMVTDRDSSSFRYSLMDFYQTDGILIGVPSADGKSVGWLDPSNRFLPMGVVDPSFQGVWGLEIDTDAWTAKPMVMPPQGKETNQRQETYDLTVDEDAIRFRLSSSFKGYEDYLARLPYYKLNGDEASKQLKETWAKDLPGYSITKASILNASDQGKPVSFELEGQKEQDGGRRMTFSPFPGKERPWWVPSSWPQERHENIVMTYRCIYSTDSTIHLPKGWTASAAEPIQYTSKLGTVSWSCVQEHEDGREVLRVHYDVQVDSMFLAPSEEGILKAFLSAMEDGWNRTLTVERPR